MPQDPAPKAHEKKRAYRYLPLYTEKYGLKVTDHDATGKVTKVMCLFCAVFGKEERSVEETRVPMPKMRKKPKTVKFFGPSFRTHNITRHMLECHSQRWEEYKTLPSSEKATYFQLGTTDVIPLQPGRGPLPSSGAPPVEPPAYGNNMSGITNFDTAAMFNQLLSTLHKLTRAVESLDQRMDQNLQDIMREVKQINVLVATPRHRPLP